jgi:hypothetical protein
MRFLKTTASDDSQFIEWVDAIIHSVVERTHPGKVYVVKIDNWFSKRWLRFSGKAVGALGVWSDELTIPPFIPSRIVSQLRFTGESLANERNERVHVYQRSGENLHRRIKRVLPPSSTLFWYSDRSRENGRGSLMAYVWNGDEYWPWYIGVECSTSWKITDCVGMTKAQVRELEIVGGFKAISADVRRSNTFLQPTTGKRGG